MALVKFQPSEDVLETSLLYERVKQFKDAGVYKHFGLNLNEFLNLPRHMVLHILKLCDNTEREAAEGAQATVNKLQMATGSGGFE